MENKIVLTVPRALFDNKETKKILNEPSSRTYLIMIIHLDPFSKKAGNKTKKADLKLHNTPYKLIIKAK